MIIDVYATILMELATAQAQPGQPGPLFAALASTCRQAIGHRLFTIMRHDAAAGRNTRLYSSDPAAYPPGAGKPVLDSAWTQRLLRQGLPFIGQDAAAIRANFADHRTILGLGCETVLNLPVRWNGQVLGTINLLHGPGHSFAGHIETGLVLAAFAIPALLAAGACPSPPPH